MDKKALHYFWLRIRPIRTIYFFVAFLVAGSICVVALRNNYQTMVDLREAVYAADQAGVDVEKALNNLRSHVNSHMNTDLTGGAEGIYPPIHLKGTYERLVQAEQDRVNTVNSKVYSDAQAHCEALYPKSFSGGPRVPCIEQYVKEHGTTKRDVPVALYKFDFASPIWSPDLAGWMLAVSAVLLGLTVIRFLAGRWLSGF